MLGVWIDPVTAQVMMILPCAAAMAIAYPGRSMRGAILFRLGLRFPPGLNFDHLVRHRQECRRDGEAEGLRRGAVDHQLQLRGLFDRKIRWSCASEDLVHIHGRT